MGNTKEKDKKFLHTASAEIIRKTFGRRATFSRPDSWQVPRPNVVF